MTTLFTTPTELSTGEPGWSPNEAQLAAAAFLARYRDRTLEAYRYDLRSFFQWADDHHLDVLAASRAHLEWYRTAMEQRGLAAATIDRRLCTVCGYHCFAHVDGRITSNPAQYVRRPKVQPSEGRGMDRLGWDRRGDSIGSVSDPAQIAPAARIRGRHPWTREVQVSRGGCGPRASWVLRPSLRWSHVGERSSLGDGDIPVHRRRGIDAAVGRRRGGDVAVAQAARWHRSTRDRGVRGLRLHDSR